MDYSYLSTSNGSGDAALMRVTAPRSVGSTTISVDTVTNVPTKFVGTSGTLLPTGLIDPATKTDFHGHIDTGSLIIEGFEPGSTDLGNTEGQIVVIKPTTQWADSIVRQALVAHNADGTIKTAILGAIWPVGAIYSETSGVNPATTFGFGTWAAYGAGQVLVGKAATGTFAAAGSVGGEERHTLLITEMPSHTHIQDAHAHNIGVSSPGYQPGAQGNNFVVDLFNNIKSTALATPTNQFTGGGGSHNNLQPYVVVYMWHRTA